MTDVTKVTVERAGIPGDDLGAIEWVIIEEWGHVEVVIRWEGHPHYRWMFFASISTPTKAEIISNEADSLTGALAGLAEQCRAWLKIPKIGPHIPEEATDNGTD